MKTQIIYLFAIILTIASSCASLPEYEYPEKAFLPGCLQGPIKNVTISTYKLDTIISSLDLEEDTTFSSALTLITKTKTRYNKKRKLIEQQTTELDEDYTHISVVSRHLRGDKNLKHYYNNSSLNSLIRYEVTTYHMIDSIKYEMENSIIYGEDSIRQVFYYDATGTLTKRDSAFIDPWLLSDAKRFTFNTNNNLIEYYTDDRDCGTINNQYITKYTPSGKLIYRTEYDYDSFGNEILKVEYAPDGKIISKKEVKIRYRHKPCKGINKGHSKAYYRKQKRDHPFYF